MKLISTTALTLCALYGLYLIPTFFSAKNWAETEQQCNLDRVQAMQAKARFGVDTPLSEACASTEATSTVFRAVVK